MLLGRKRCHVWRKGGTCKKKERRQGDPEIGYGDCSTYEGEGIDESSKKKGRLTSSN